jgi:hypothetical protein
MVCGQGADLFADTDAAPREREKKNIKTFLQLRTRHMTKNMVKVARANAKSESKGQWEPTTGRVIRTERRLGMKW